MFERTDIKSLVKVIEDQSAAIADMKTTMDNQFRLIEENSKQQTALLELIAHRLIDPPKSPGTN